MQAGRGSKALLRHIRHNYAALPMLKIQITTLHVTCIMNYLYDLCPDCLHAAYESDL